LADRIELAAAQRSYQVTSDCDLVSFAAGKSLFCQGIDPPIKRSANLSAEAGAGKKVGADGQARLRLVIEKG